MKSESKVFKKISSYYDNLVGAYGYNPKACDYGQAESQRIKFSVLAECTDYSGKSVLDIGCGFADYYKYLSERYGRVDYHGVDLSYAMIQKAKEIHPTLPLQMRNVFEQAPDRKYDVVTANGIFYLLGSNAVPIMQQFISKMYDMCIEVVAFNTLSSWTSDKEEGEFYADPCSVLAFCHTLSPWITIRHDYHTRDFAVFIYKNRKP